MSLSAITLSSRALIKIGARSISSFDDGSTEAEVAASLYPGVRDAVLSAHPWTFATAQADLPRLSGVPVADYPYAFELPPDFLRALSAGGSGRGRGVGYRIAESRLHAPSENMTLTYIFRAAESTFPAFFASALVARLAAEFCLPLTEVSSRGEALQRQAELELRAARLIDSQQDTPRGIEDFSLIAARG